MIAFHVALVGLLVGTQLAFTSLAVLNVRYSAQTIRERATWLEESLGLSDPEQNVDYLLARTGIGQLESWVILGGTLLVLYSGVYRDGIAAVAGLGLGPIAEGVILLLGITVVLQLAAVPFSLVSTFVIEEIFDFNRQTLGVWTRDQVIGLVVAGAVTAAVGGGILWAIETLGPWWPLAGVVMIAVMSLVLLVVLPRVILPMQFEFTPIEDGDLRDSVERVFEKAGFTCEGIYEVELSSHTAKSNAFFMGFGPAKRVGLGDTLIENHERREIESVLAHELAHYKLRHIWKRMGAMLAKYGIVLVALAVLIDQPWLTAMFGLPETSYAALVTGALWLWPVLRLTAPLDNRLSIHHEYQADAFAAETTGDPEAEISSLAKLADDNLGNPFPHPWYVMAHYDHPPIPKRIQAVREGYMEDGPVEPSDADAGDGPTAS